jgi:uncharacterized protein (DUF2267 family)
MSHDEFVHAIMEATGIADRELAERSAIVILQAICDRITGDEAADLLSQLPVPIKERISTSEAASRMKPREFVARVATELQLPPEEARERIRAVFAVLKRAVTPGEFHDVLVQLPSGIAELALV